MADFHKHVAKLVEKEGGYRLTDHPHDRGGRTYAGISERSNPHWRGWKLIDRGAPPSELREAAHELYRDEYWDPIHGDDLRNDDVVEMLLSSSVLSGPGTAARFAQLAVDVKPDGHIGPVSIKALDEIDVDLFEARFCIARIMRYVEITDKNPSQRVWFRGWVRRAVKEVG